MGLLWHSTEVYPAEKDGQHYTVIMQHALGNTVVHRLGGRKVTTIVMFATYPYTLHVHTHHTTTHHKHPLHTHLEQVAGDNAQPLAIVNHSLQVGVSTQDHLEYIQEEPQGVLV